MNVGTHIADTLSRFLDLSAEKMKLTASNMANVDTPGYRTQGFDFSTAMQDALRFDEGGAGAGTSHAHVAVGDVAGLVARPDGNNVSMDREGLELATAQLQFRTGVELLKHQFARTMSAIHADGK